MPGLRSWSINSLLFIASSLRDLCVCGEFPFVGSPRRACTLSRPAGSRIILALMGKMPAPQRAGPRFIGAGRPRYGSNSLLYFVRLSRGTEARLIFASLEGMVHGDRQGG